MGLYINPRNGDKIAWLEGHAVATIPLHLVVTTYEAVRDKGCVPVIWVHNGLFDALGVAFNRRECQDFADSPGDKRPKRAFVVKISDLTTDTGIDQQELVKFGLA